VAVSLVSTLGGFLFGYDTAVISGCNTFLEAQYELTSAMLGWVVSSALLGTILGCIISSAVTDKYGRKLTLILAAGSLTISAVGSVFPPQFTGDLSNPNWVVASSEFSFIFLVIVRIIGGIGVGITSVVAPIYISELTLPEKRGRLVSLYQLSITLGILLAFLIDWIILSSAGDAAGVLTESHQGFFNWLFVEEIWRGMFGTEIPIATLFLFLLFLIPESPRWLILQGRQQEAYEILVRVGGEQRARMQLDQIEEVTKEESGGFKDLLRPYLRRPLIIGILLPLFSHLSGIAAIMYFAPNILNESIKNVESSFLGAVLVGLVNSVFTFIAIANIEKFGRRKLLLIGVTGAFISLAGVGVLFALDSGLVIIPLLMYVACFAFSYGPVVWVLISEIFPTSIRGLAVGMGSLSLMVTGFVITLTNPVFIETISPAGTFFLYAILTIPAIWFIYRFVPETKGKTLEEIELDWRKSENQK